MEDRQLLARLEIEASFRTAVDRDVELVASQQAQERGLPGEALLPNSDAFISELIWSHFGPFDWSSVAYVYDGTYGHASRYLWAKVELTLAWAAAGGPRDAAGLKAVQPELLQAVVRLRALWVEWAGYQATKSDFLAFALQEEPRGA